MDIAYIQEEDRKFLVQSVRFCQGIDPYITLLGLDAKEVAAFRDDVDTVVYITEHYKSFAHSFFLYNLGTMRKRMLGLVKDCLLSVNYTKNAGKILGIEERTKFNITDFNQLPFYIGRQN
jgi:hypothetical protein